MHNEMEMDDRHNEMMAANRMGPGMQGDRGGAREDQGAQDREADYDLANLWNPGRFTYSLNAPVRKRGPWMRAEGFPLISGIDRLTDKSREYSHGKFVQP